MSAAAQSTVRIVDADGRGIPGVALIAPDGSGFVTDGQGELELDAEQTVSGEWRLRCLGFVDLSLIHI